MRPVRFTLPSLIPSREGGRGDRSLSAQEPEDEAFIQRDLGYDREGEINCHPEPCGTGNGGNPSLLLDPHEEDREERNGNEKSKKEGRYVENADPTNDLKKSFRLLRALFLLFFLSWPPGLLIDTMELRRDIGPKMS